MTGKPDLARDDRPSMTAFWTKVIHAVACPECGASRRKPCKRHLGGQVRLDPHAARKALYHDQQAALGKRGRPRRES